MASNRRSVNLGKLLKDFLENFVIYIMESIQKVLSDYSNYLELYIEVTQKMF